MMKEYLIDTHVCLWALGTKEKLSYKVSSLIEDNSVKIFVSQVSLFEIAVKLKVGKLPAFKISLSEFIKSVDATGFEILPIKNEHFMTYTSINFDENHRDPFDRLLLATASFERLFFITKDEKFQNYSKIVDIIW